jgi:hypothetical protein
MALLKAIVAKIDDVDEKYRDLYTVKKDAKGVDVWEIQIEGGKTQGDIDRVNAALIKERKEHGEVTAKFKVATESLAAFGETTPAQVAEFTEKLANLEAAGASDIQKNFQELLATRVAAVVDGKTKVATDKLTKQLNDLTVLHTTAVQENDKLKLSDLYRTIDDSVRDAAVASKMLPAAQVDALMRARSAFAVVDGKVVTTDGLTPSDWVEQRKADAGYWWPVARGAGAQGSDGAGGFLASDNPWTRNNWNVTKQGEIVRADPAKAERFATSAGSKVGATAPAPKDA